MTVHQNPHCKGIAQEGKVDVYSEKIYETIDTNVKHVLQSHLLKNK